MNTTKTINGVTLVDNGDGTITVSGMPTASISYTLSGMDMGKNLVFVLMEYDESGTKIKQENSRSISYKASDNASYIRIYIDRINSNVEVPETVVRPQLEIGSSSTKYEPYTSTTTNIYLNEPLRKVGEYADYLDLKNQRVVRNVKVNDNTGTKTIEESYTKQDPALKEKQNLPNISFDKKANIIKIGTSVNPSKIDAIYSK